MSDSPVPPLADPHLLEERFRALARPFYELVNQDPATELFPSPLNADEQERYRACLEEVFGRSVLRLELVSSRRTPGIIGRSGALTEYAEDVVKGRAEDGNIFQLLNELNDRTEDITLDTEFEEVPNDLFDRAIWFYDQLQQRPTLPPLPAPRYGHVMCRVLAMGMGQPHELIGRIYPFILRNPPLGFLPFRADIYRVLVA